MYQKRLGAFCLALLLSASSFSATSFSIPIVVAAENQQQKKHCCILS